MKNLRDSIWEVLLRPSGKAPSGSVISFNQGDLNCRILEKTRSGSWSAELMFDGDFFGILERLGKIPLPPYIKREPEAQDKDRYQTIYAREKGAVAAPTAGLHFTRELLKEIEEKGIHIIPVTLHVGWDSFRPVRADNPEDHNLQSEHFKIDQSSADRVNQFKKNGRRIVAVGTTTVRALETAVQDQPDEGDSEPHRIQAMSGWTDKFIYPPYRFKVVDCLITNFHLPRSTLLLLVSAFATRELILRAYQEAIDQRYRFYSYGDAMLII